MDVHCGCALPLGQPSCLVCGSIADALRDVPVVTPTSAVPEPFDAGYLQYDPLSVASPTTSSLRTSSSEAVGADCFLSKWDQGEGNGSPHRRARPLVTHEEKSTLTRDRTALHYHTWMRPRGEAQALVLVVHDFATHALRTCRHVVPALVAAGNCVVAFDIRGHGESERRHVKKAARGRNGEEVDEGEVAAVSTEWMDDIVTILRTVATESGVASLPVVLYGDGFGASMILDFGLRAGRDLIFELQIAGFACSGTQLGQLFQSSSVHNSDSEDSHNGSSDEDDCIRPVSPKSETHQPRSPSAFLMRTLSDIASALQITDHSVHFTPRECGLEPLTLTSFSRDLRVGEMVRSDLRRVEKVTKATAEAAKRLVARVTELASEWRYPLAVLHGGADSFARADLAKSFAEKSFGMFRSYEGARHWLHHEIMPAREEFLRDLVVFVDSVV
mmetsp:Transcript_22607/g.55228  ORF Transcript_22607/g.55228 Transcript_22607/m.55228 type:complete len:445 (+) Transcript_22607:280-1614(+)